MIPYAKLSPDLKVSRVMTGLWQIADMEKLGKSVNLSEASRAMYQYSTAGFTSFDMADHYGSAELISGAYLEKYAMKQPVQLFTKWVPKPGLITKKVVREAVQLSLKRMNADSLDLLQFHAWNYADPNWLDGLYLLQELKKEGLIRHLGLTNFDAAHLHVAMASDLEIVSNQVSYSLIDQRAKFRLTEISQQYGVHILAFGTLAGGFLTEKWLGKPEPANEELTTWSLMKYKRFIDAAGGWKKFQSLLNKVQEIAIKHRVSVANVACRYILDQPCVAGIILGARLGISQHIKENYRIFSFQLDEDDKYEIAKAQEPLDPIPGDCGEEYRKAPFLTASGDLSHHVDTFPRPYEVVHESVVKAKAFSNTPWEEMAGYCRAVRRDNRIFVSGTTATHRDKMIGGNDAAAQTHFIIDKIEGAITSLGGKIEDVVRTRIFIHNMEDWEKVARAHGHRFHKIQPANTLVQTGLIGEGYLVEIEAEAVIS